MAVLLSERSEQDTESETHSNAEENHNTDMDEEHDIDMDDEAREGVNKEGADDADGAPTHTKDEFLDKKPVVVLMPDPAIDAKVEVKVKDEPEEEAKSQAEVRVFCLCVVASLLFSEMSSLTIT